jgi:hypothetical protein
VALANFLPWGADLLHCVSGGVGGFLGVSGGVRICGGCPGGVEGSMAPIMLVGHCKAGCGLGAYWASL